MTEDDREILAELRALGLNERNFRAIALLPLIEVAWADGRTQKEERRVIAEIAHGHGLLQGGGDAMLKRWLTERPSEEYFERARHVFVRLALHKEGLGADMPEASLEFVVDLCTVVAEAAGGLFGMFFTTSDTERRAIGEIAQHIENEAARLNPQRGVVGRTISMDWKKLMEALDVEK